MRGARLDWLILFTLVAIWGSAFAALKIAVHEIPPAWIMAGRLVVGAGLLLAWARIAGEKIPPLSDSRAWRAYGLIGTIGTAAPFFLFAWASARMDSTLVAICNGASPFFTAILAAGMLGDRLDARRIAGIALGFLGLLTLAAPGLMNAGASAQALGVAAGLAGAACYAFANVVVKSAPDVGPIAASAMFSLAGMVAAVPIAALTAPFPATASPAAWLSVTALGLGPSGVASILYVVLIRRRGPLFTAYTTYLIPIWAAAVGVVFLAERPGVEAAIALALVMAGLALSNWPSQPRRSAAR